MDRLRSLDGANHGVVANAKCLGEGVDVPTLDAIAFIEPRRSETDIIQAVGRAIRLAPDKKIGTILVMVFVDGANPEQALESKVWKPIVDVLNALRSHDPDFGLKLDAIRRDLGRFGKGKVRSEVLPPIVFPESWTSDEAKTFTKALDVKIIQTATFVDHEGILAALKAKAGVA
jgi:predicted helicase